MSRPIIGFAGMTHLGLVSAAAAAERGFAVIGFDQDAGRVGRLGRGELEITEPGLPELVMKNGSRLSFTSSVTDLAACDVLYVAVDVPTDDHGVSDLDPIRALVDAVAPVLRADALLVILSQVPPGFTRSLDRPPARRFYQAETLVFGRAVERALNPERFILGCADPKAPLPAPLAEFLGAFDCPILPMRYESAELAKISVNMCLVASISTVNSLAELCERIGADWSEIIPALKLDRRIGPSAYLSPGLGIAGGNLERDLSTFCRLADAHGTDAGVVRAWIANSRHRRDWVLAQLHERVIGRISCPVFAVLGLTYKADTAATKNAPALALAAALKPFEVRVYDPAVAPPPDLHPRLKVCGSALEACTAADALVVMTPWAEFRQLDLQAVASRMRGRTVIDPFAALDAAASRAAGLDYVTLGRPPASVDGSPKATPC